MAKQGRSRRELFKLAALGAGSALIRSLAPGTAEAQLPSPKPSTDPAFKLVVTTASKPWQAAEVFQPTFDWTMLNLAIGEPVGAPMQGFGACFSELGWKALGTLSEADLNAVMRELFDPSAGARFTYCRTPIATDDFATDGYTYDETDGDFALRHFSIEHDRTTLIPFIHAAQKHQPNLRLWASPWTPPAWMKRNHFYAEAAAMPGMGFKDNGIRPDQVGHEGEDMFILKPEYLQAYARYFGRYVDAYRAEGIRVGMVMPQNEFNSAQNFPSCTWTPQGLIQFLHALGPEMAKRNVDIFMGTMERPDPALIETILADPQAAQYVKGLGMQWAGKSALPALHKEYPALTVFQSEQECGDGQNAWSYTTYAWQLMKQYFRNGASGYMYWNIAMPTDPRSTWGWPQNSLVTVDAQNRTSRFNHDFYLLKHLSHFVDVGAHRCEVNGTCDDALAFQNPGGGTVVLLRNAATRPQLVQVQAQKQSVVVNLPEDSIATLTIARA